MQKITHILKLWQTIRLVTKPRLTPLRIVALGLLITVTGNLNKVHIIMVLTQWQRLQIGQIRTQICKFAQEQKVQLIENQRTSMVQMMPISPVKQRLRSTTAWKNCSKSTVNWKRTRLRNGWKIKCNLTNSRSQVTVSKPTPVVKTMRRKLPLAECQLSKPSIWWATKR